MSIFDKILSAPFKGLIDGIGSVVDRFVTTGDEKNAFMLEVQKLAMLTESRVDERLAVELQAKERVLVAELQQDDNYTKRARPTVVYVGLGAFLFNYVIVPNIAILFGTTLEPVAFPTEFWVGWSGIVATWTIGRSVEKRATTNGTDPGKLIGLITGNGK